MEVYVIMKGDSPWYTPAKPYDKCVRGFESLESAQRSLQGIKAAYKYIQDIGATYIAKFTLVVEGDDADANDEDAA